MDVSPHMWHALFSLQNEGILFQKRAKNRSAQRLRYQEQLRWSAWDLTAKAGGAAAKRKAEQTSADYD